MVGRMSISLSAQSVHGIRTDKTRNQTYVRPPGLLCCLLSQDAYVSLNDWLRSNKKSEILLEYVPWMFVDPLDSFLVLYIHSKTIMNQMLRYEALRAVFMNSSVFWDIMSSSPLKVNACFGENCRLSDERRGRVCNLLFLLVLASAVPLGSALSA
jgi:hypothetical protein